MTVFLKNVFLMLILEGALFIWLTTLSSFHCKGSLCEIRLNKVFFNLPADYILLGIYVNTVI